jgi:hypothetical protein
MELNQQPNPKNPPPRTNPIHNLLQYLGTMVNASLITGLNEPSGIAVSGSNLFVANISTGTVGEYTTGGAMVNPSLITGLHFPQAIAVSGSNLFVPDSGSGTAGTGKVAEYTTSGAVLNTSLITGLNYPVSIAVSGGNLFVVNGGTLNVNGANFVPGTGSIGEYTTSGATVNASLISGLTNPSSIAVPGANLFFPNYTGGTIGEYTTAGAMVDTSLVSGLNSPAGIVVLPEPSSIVIAVLGFIGLAAWGWRRQQR